MTRPSRRDALAALALAASARTARAGDPAGEIRRIIDRAVASGRIPGAVVIVRKDGRNVVEEAAGYAVIEQRRPMRADDLFMIASSTKPFTATAVLTLADQGKLGLDDPVRRYYPAFQGSSTIRQLLSHTSGVFGNDAPPEVVESIRNFDRTLGASVELIVRQPLAYQPGAKFSYGGASFCVAAAIAEKVSGLETDELLQSAVLEPLGVTEACFRSATDLSARVPQIYERSAGRFQPRPAVMEAPGRRGPRPSGFILAAGGLYISPADTVRFLDMHRNRGVYNGRRILSQRMVEEMQQRQTGKAGEEYGLGWRRHRIGPDGRALAVSHGGAYGTQLLIDHERDLTAAIFTQMPSAQAKEFLTEAQQAIERLYE